MTPRAMNARAVLGALALWTLPATAVAQRPAADPVVARFDRYVQHAMEQWGVPGVAVALVRDGRIVATQGFGVRTLGKPDRVDEHTVFAIGSATKSFTAAVLATLVDAHKLAWDDRVRTYLPEVAFADDRITDLATVRDLVAQRTCIGEKNLLTWNTPFDRAELFRRLRYLKPVCTFRERFEYNNLHFVLAGQIAAVVAGESWDALVRDRLFVPLGMTESTTSPRDAAQRANLATPYLRIGGSLKALPLFDEGASAAAGSIHSTAADMARWLLAQMNDGRVGGTPLWSPATAHEMHQPQMVIAPTTEYALLLPAAEFRTYGLGWFIDDFHGERVVEHAGQTDGMHALVSMMPDKKLGIVVLTNTSLIGLPTALAYRWYDENLGARPRDWSSEIIATMRPINDGIDPAAIAASVPRIPGTHPSRPLDAYAGTYTDSLLGDATVTRDAAGGLAIGLLGRSGRLDHWHYDTFRADWGGDLYLSLAVPYVTFQLDANAKPVVLDIGTGDRFALASRDTTTAAAK